MTIKKQEQLAEIRSFVFNLENYESIHASATVYLGYLYFKQQLTDFEFYANIDEMFDGDWEDKSAAVKLMLYIEENMW